MIDEGEDPYQAAFREFKEETGYTAQRLLPGFENLSGYNSPWFCTENGVSICVEVDFDHPYNQNPK